MRFQISQHALEEMKRRGLSKAFEDYLVRVIVNDTLEPAKVVTVYKTSRIMKYWREK